MHDRLSALEFPVLAKPPLSSGGIGNRRFESLEGLAGFLAQQPSDERWVVQTIIEGRNVGVNVLCRGRSDSRGDRAARNKGIIQPIRVPDRHRVQR
jgi:predicted ATP-grasp superfamily ATP-dependent carboligase